MISIVIITRNRIGLLKQTLEKNIQNALLNNGEVIVVNNNSEDGSTNYLKERAKDVDILTVIHNNKNKGIAPARNQGLKLAKFKVVLCLDDDMLIDEQNYLKCETIFKKHLNAGVIAPVSIDFETKRQLNNPFSIKEFCEVSNHHGSFGIFLREAILKADFLDEECVYGGEERSLCMKVHAAGYDILFEPEIFGVHIDTINRKKPDLFRVKMRVYNNVRLNFKYLPYAKAFKFSLRVFLSYFKYSFRAFGIKDKIILINYFIKGIKVGLNNRVDFPEKSSIYYSNSKLYPFFGNNNFFS